MVFIASYEKTIQVAEDAWRVSLRTKVCDENTTIGQIKKWYLEDRGFIAMSAPHEMNDIKISEPSGR